MKKNFKLANFFLPSPRAGRKSLTVQNLRFYNSEPPKSKNKNQTRFLYQFSLRSILMNNNFLIQNLDRVLLCIGKGNTIEILKQLL